MQDIRVEPPSEKPWLAIASDEDVRNSYRLFLGRSVESLAAMRLKHDLTVSEVIAEILGSEEFERHIVDPMRDDGQVGPWLYDGFPRPRLLEWAARTLPMSARAKASLLKCETWRDAVITVFSASDFRRQIVSKADGEHLTDFAAHLERHRDRPMAQIAWQAAR